MPQECYIFSLLGMQQLFWLINVSKYFRWKIIILIPRYKETDLVGSEKRKKKDPLSPSSMTALCWVCCLNVFNGQCMVIQLSQILHTIIIWIFFIFYCKLLTQIRIHNIHVYGQWYFWLQNSKPLLWAHERAHMWVFSGISSKSSLVVVVAAHSIHSRPYDYRYIPSRMIAISQVSLICLWIHHETLFSGWTLNCMHTLTSADDFLLC